MAKVFELTDVTEKHMAYVFFCPGCGYHHEFDSRWTFNGDYDKPTFSHSLLINQHKSESRCHSFVRDGKIEFLSDSFHSLAGQTVELPEVD